MSSSFHNFQKVSLVRHAEQSSSSTWYAELESAANAVDPEVAQIESSFKEKVSIRAEQLASVSGLTSSYAKMARKFSKAIVVLFALLAILGFFAVLQSTTSTGSTINIYWLLLVLLGVNLASMLLWLLMMMRGSVRSAPLASSYRALVAKLTPINDAPLYKAWSETHILGNTGKWFLSKQLHACWLLYLAGGLLALLLVLSGTQLDFVWGTTILLPETFVTLTHWLGWLPATLGFEVPSNTVILSSVQGASEEQLASNRGVWANFILVSVVVYALIPRLLLWMFCWLCLHQAKRSYQPDWELPYFYALRTHLLPENKSLGIVDEDQYPQDAPASEKELGAKLKKLDELELPHGAYVAAFEWGLAEVPHVPVGAAVQLNTINDVNEQRGLLQAVTQTPMSTVILVQLGRAADRGATRFLREINALGALYLVVVQTEIGESDSARWAGWQAVAEQLGLSSEQLHLVRS